MHVIRAAALGLLLSLPAWGQTALVTNNPPYSIQAGDTPGFTSSWSTRWQSC